MHTVNGSSFKMYFIFLKLYWLQQLAWRQQSPCFPPIPPLLSALFTERKEGDNLKEKSISIILLIKCLPWKTSFLTSDSLGLMNLLFSVLNFFRNMFRFFSFYIDIPTYLCLLYSVQISIILMHYMIHLCTDLTVW